MSWYWTRRDGVRTAVGIPDDEDRLVTAYGPSLKPPFLPMCGLPCAPRPPLFPHSGGGSLRCSPLLEPGCLKLNLLAHLIFYVLHMFIYVMRDPYAEQGDHRGVFTNTSRCAMSS
ncbi:hypothetical protein CEP51_016620 [Fusarium floridanum]|uniref:Uncharacterized protein n=1 Tax=Fusarium floridanum TaxID=1325733 RepID=A0A428NJW7_9HYPO|nr:hypothetical protein CEP51_016620 [Fusarium floridanum]